MVEMDYSFWKPSRTRSEEPEGYIVLGSLHRFHSIGLVPNEVLIADHLAYCLCRDKFFRIPQVWFYGRKLGNQFLLHNKSLGSRVVKQEKQLLFGQVSAQENRHCA